MTSATEKIFQNILNEGMLLNEKRIELQNEHPVTKDEIIRFFDISERIQWRGKYDDKKLRIYIESTDRSGKERYDLLGEVEPTSIGYILRGRDGHYYQGESYEDFKSDMMDAIRHFDSNVFNTLEGSGEDVLNDEFKEAAYALGKLRLYCGLDEISTRWDHDDNDIPYIVDSKNNPPLFTVKWADTEEHPKSYAVSDGKTTEFFSDKESAYQKIEDIMRQRSALLERKGDFKKYALLGAAALGLGAVKVADINSIKSAANELNIKVPAIEYSSSHKGAKLIKPIYKYKYDGKGPMDIDSLCKWLELNTEFEDIWYEEDGDNYVIKYRNRYYSYADDSSNPKRRTTYGKIDLPKSYFDGWAYSLDENKKLALFDKLLKE